MIRSGAVAYELTRPLDLYTLWYVRQLAARSAPTLLRSIPLFCLAVSFFGMGVPPSFLAGVTAFLSLGAALLLTTAFITVITVSLLWTVSGDGIARLAPSLVLLGCGLIIPLPLFPQALQPLLHFLPFSGMADTPFRLYMGHLPPESLSGVLLHQLGWAVFFVVLGRFLLWRGTRVLVVQGG
jgi:ABC-2 type transport system permease protein